MPDSFFQSDKKRKRPARSGESSDGPSRGGSSRGVGGGRGGGRGFSSSRGGGGGGGGRGGRPSSDSTSGYDKPFRPSAYGKGQKVQGQARHAANRKSRAEGRERDEDLSSDAEGDDGGDLDDMDFRGDQNRDREDEEVIDENETGAEKRVRLARGYLKKVQDEVEAAKDDQDYDAAEIDRELIAARLQKDVSETEGRIHSFLASRPLSITSKLVKLPTHIPTSVALTPTSLVVSTKRGLMFRYALPSLQQIGKPFGQAQATPATTSKGLAAPTGHTGELYCVAASEDGRFIVSGGKDKLVGVWEVSEEGGVKWLTGMRGHKDSVTSIAFPPLSNPSHHILSASLSRHLALHSLSTLSAIDTFFGHQDSISSISSLKPTLAVTAGSRDRTCRWWKVEEEIQLVFRGGGKSFEGQSAKGEAKKGEPAEEEIGADGMEVDRRKEKGKGRGKEFIEGSIDTVCMLDDQRFVSGGDSGSLCLWQTAKKKPIFTHPLAHGVDNLLHEDDKEMTGPRWITAIGALRGSDIFATGSWDGVIRLWALDPALRAFKPIHTIAVPGFINSIQILSVPSSSVTSETFSNGANANGEEAEMANGGGDQVRKGKSAKGKMEILLVAAVAQEPGLGRWMSIKKGVKSGAFVAHLKFGEEGRGAVNGTEL